jgi:hypothetical protein
VTHHFDSDQRVIRIPVQSASGNQLTLLPLPTVAQGGNKILPSGYYMLFVVTKPLRIPSVAVFVHVM